MGRLDRERTDKLIDNKKLLHSCETELRQNEEIRKDLETRNKELLSKIKQLTNSIIQLEKESKGLVITDHAILRYMERKFKMPIEDVKKEILLIINSCGREKLGIGDSSNCLGFVIRGNSVITYKGN